MAVQLRSLKTSAGAALLNSIYTKTSRYYYFFAQSTAYDVDAPTESAFLDYENETRNNIFAIKEVLPSDATMVVPRVDYTPGTNYLGYSTRTGTYTYVYNETNFSIYLCMVKGSGVSTIEPSHTTTNPMTLGDGYVWRYIYTIPLAIRDKFLTPEWIPVSNTLTETFFSNGGIDTVSIVDGGDGYAQTSTSIVISDSSGNGHGAMVEPVVSSGKIVSLIVHNPGYGYISPIVNVLSPVATRKAILSPSLSKGDIRSSQALVQTLAKAGTIESAEIISAGTGYTSNTSISLLGDGTGGAVSFTRNTTTGQITSISVTNRGENYTWAKVVLTDTPAIGGSGFSCHLNLSPIKGFGYDAVSDLGASTVMMYQALSRESIGDNPLTTSIRQFGLVVDPKSTQNSSYPNQQSSKTNFVSTIDLVDISKYPVGTVVTNEFPTTPSSWSFIVDEQIVGKTGGIRLRATNNGKLVVGSRYYKDATDSFVATYPSEGLIIDKRFVSACYTLRTTSPSFFDINTFAVGNTLTNGGNRFVIVSASSLSIAVSSIDGGKLITGDTLIDGASNVLTPQTIDDPIFDKKSGKILTIEQTSPVAYNQMQSVSFRTVLTF